MLICLKNQNHQKNIKFVIEKLVQINKGPLLVILVLENLLNINLNLKLKIKIVRKSKNRGIEINLH